MAKKKVASLHSIDIKILEILKDNPEGLRVKTIKKILDVKQRTIYNHLRGLEKKGIIKNLYPMWKIGKVQTATEILQTRLDSEKEQGHRMTFILPLIKKPVWWEKRKDRLVKLKEWQYKKEITARNNVYHQIENELLKVQFYKNSVYFFCKKNYIGNTPVDVFIKAMEDVLEAIRFFEERWKFKFILEGNEHLTVQDGHYLTYQDALSDYCEKIDDRFRFKTKEGYDLWVDFSDPKGTEANNPEVKRRYLMDIKDRQDHPETPVASKIWDLTTKTAQNQDNLVKDIQELVKVTKDVVESQKQHQESMVYLDRNLQTHFEVLDKIGKAVDKLSKEVAKLSKNNER